MRRACYSPFRQRGLFYYGFSLYVANKKGRCHLQVENAKKGAKAISEIPKKREDFGVLQLVLFAVITLGVLVLCVCVGSVSVPLSQTVQVVWRSLTGQAVADASVQSIIMSVRLPRVLATALMGAALSLCGGAMQGLLRNPLADGSTLGVSAGASLGAVLSIIFGFTLPFFPGAGTAFLSMTFGFLSLVVILALARRLDNTLSTNTIILLGIIFSMFMNSVISLAVTFAGEKTRSVLFWTLGSMAGSTWLNVLTLILGLALVTPVILHYAKELNAFSISEENARHLGIDVQKVKLTVLVLVSVLIGICVSIGGTIGFVGLVIPHITRMLTGPNHRRLFPATLFIGAGFLMLADLLSRVLFSPRELPIGVVTSLVGAVVFLVIFYRARR